MKIILNSDVSNLGEEGDVKDVADGYARNFLIPKGMVMPYSRQNLALIESRRATIEKRKEDKREQAKTARERLEGESVTIQMTAGERGKLFGSVTSQTIAEELEKRGIDVERKKIDIEDGTIKTLGTHTVRVRLYADEEAQLKVVVEPDEKSAARQQSAPAGKGPAKESPAEESPAEEAATPVAAAEEEASAETGVEAEATATDEEATEEEAAEEEALEGEEDRE
jgi:large subunit ribosomal protein L9